MVNLSEVGGVCFVGSYLVSSARIEGVGLFWKCGSDVTEPELPAKSDVHGTCFQDIPIPEDHEANVGEEATSPDQPMLGWTKGFDDWCLASCKCSARNFPVYLFHRFLNLYTNFHFSCLVLKDIFSIIGGTEFDYLISCLINTTEGWHHSVENRFHHFLQLAYCRLWLSRAMMPIF